MATKRPSFLKRQKELKRTARALEKRDARRGRKEARAAEHDNVSAPDLLVEEAAKNHDTEP
jgi:hypothetical protein